MFRRVIHLLLIADLLVCPLLCSAGGLAAGCCESAPATAPAATATEATPAPCCCCPHTAVPEPDPNAPTAPAAPKAPVPAPEKCCPADCICKGAIVDRAPLVDVLSVTDHLGVLPAAVAARPTNHALSFYSSSFLVSAGGRDVRTLLMSLLC